MYLLGVRSIIEYGILPYSFESGGDLASTCHSEPEVFSQFFLYRSLSSKWFADHCINPQAFGLHYPPMVFMKTTFTRLFPDALSGTGLMTCTSFGFESAGTRFFSVTVPGKPRIEQGMTVIALLETPNGFREDNGLLGWVDCGNGSIVCDSAFNYFGMFLLQIFFAIMFPMKAYIVISTPENANLVASLIAALFGCFACQCLYISVKSLLVKRALVAVRGCC